MKDKRNSTGEGRYPEWEYFDAMDTILGHRPATKPPVVVESIAVGDTVEVSEETDSSPTLQAPDADISASNSTVSDSPGSQPSTSSQNSQDVVKRRSKKRNKRQSSSLDKMDTITSAIIGTLTDLQKSSDCLTMELEEKRLKFEEKQAEREERQRQEERQFQVQMMQTMMMGNAPAPPGRMHVGEPSHTPYGSIDAFPPFPDNN